MNVACAESHSEDADAEAHPFDQCLFKEVGKYESGFGSSFRILQLLLTTSAVSIIRYGLLPEWKVA